jgi:hypothetical protein
MIPLTRARVVQLKTRTSIENVNVYEINHCVFVVNQMEKRVSMLHLKNMDIRVRRAATTLRYMTLLAKLGTTD